MMKHHSNQQGSALLIVLILIATCSAVTFGFMTHIRQEALGAKATVRVLHADEKTLSGIEIAMAELARDLKKTEFDHGNETWAQLFADNSPYASLVQSLQITGHIQDEASRFPINRITDENGIDNTTLAAFTRLLRQPEIGLTADDAALVTQRIADWIDADTITADNKPEIDVYRAAGLPYAPKNAPLTTISELLLIPGVTAAVYHGKNDGSGLKDLTTVRSDKKININTASVPVLTSLVPQNKPDSLARKVAESIAKAREDKHAGIDFNNPEWYRSLLPASLNTPLTVNLITTQGMNFTAVITTEAHGFKRSRTSWLRRSVSAGNAPTVAIVAQEVR